MREITETLTMHYYIETWQDTHCATSTVTGPDGERTVYVHNHGPEGIAQLLEMLEDAEAAKGSVS